MSCVRLSGPALRDDGAVLCQKMPARVLNSGTEKLRGLSGGKAQIKVVAYSSRSWSDKVDFSAVEMTKVTPAPQPLDAVQWHSGCSSE